MVELRACCGFVVVTVGTRHPDDLPEGYHATIRGQARERGRGRANAQSQGAGPRWSSRAGRLPPDRDVIGLRQVDEMARATAV